MDKQKYTRKIAAKRKGSYISTEDILKIIEEAIKEYAFEKDTLEIKSGDIPYTKTNAIAGQDLRGIK